MENQNTPLVNQTFVERIFTGQELARKEFIKLRELKKVDSDNSHKEYLRQRSLQKSLLSSIKDQHLVFNYMLHRFPEIMASNVAHNNWQPDSIREMMGDAEFSRILKLSKRFFRFIVFLSAIPTMSLIALMFVIHPILFFPAMAMTPLFLEYLPLLSEPHCRDYHNTFYDPYKKFYNLLNLLGFERNSLHLRYYFKI